MRMIRYSAQLDLSDCASRRATPEQMVFVSILKQAAQDAMYGDHVSSVRGFVESEWFVDVLGFAGLDIDIPKAREKFEALCKVGDKKLKFRAEQAAGYRKIERERIQESRKKRKNALSMKSIAELAKLANGEG